MEPTKAEADPIGRGYFQIKGAAFRHGPGRSLGQHEAGEWVVQVNRTGSENQGHNPECSTLPAEMQQGGQSVKIQLFRGRCVMCDCNGDGDSLKMLEATVEESHEFAALGSKVFTWGRLTAGDCTLKFANMTLWSDGLADFNANVTTSSHNDVWIVKGLALIGSEGHELSRIPKFDGPNMVVSNFDYYISRFRQLNPLSYPTQLFPLITGVTMFYHC
ncbi:DUF6294 family protein [Streptomyces sp. NPDC127069]|uniref:DUF6294 family protein n=1 Tax=Streptomyces sp. NPDC127069 TaxID=3347128 RepID=UPI00365E01E9